ncbi:MAG: ABC transporter substrate-binding protein [Oscillospiraceae bacterium]
MKIKIFAAALSAALILTAFSGCAQVEEDAPEVTQVTEEEVLPYPVTIGSLVFNAAPETVGSLSPAITDMIAELGFSDKLVGVSSYCSFEGMPSDLADLGSSANPDAQAIIKAAPELLISHSPIAKKDITAIESTGTRVLIIPAPTSVEELCNLYHDIYRVFSGSDENEEQAVSACFEKLQNTFEIYDGMLGSYVYIMSSKLAFASDESFCGDFFSHFGKNAAANEEGISVTKERLIELDPEYVIIPSGMKLSRLPEELSAVKNNKVIRLDKDTEQLLERPTSEVYKAADFVNKAIKALDEPEQTEKEEDEQEKAAE